MEATKRESKDTQPVKKVRTCSNSRSSVRMHSTDAMLLAVTLIPLPSEIVSCSRSVVEFPLIIFTSVF